MVGTIVDVKPRRGRGPGVVILDTGSGAVEATTFDSALLKLAMDARGLASEYEIQEKPSKDGSKTYTNLVRLSVAPVSEAVSKSVPEPGKSEQGDTASSLSIFDADGHPVPELVMPMQGDLQRAGATQEQALARLETGYQIAKRRHELVLELLRSRMKEGTHYVDGAMFGGKKPVLLQPGAHAIFQAVGFSCVPTVIHGPMEAPEDPKQKYTIVVKTEVCDAEGRLVGAQLGSCSSHIYSKNQMAYIPRAVDPDKTHNSTLKMATKRSTVASCRQTTPASELFAEDLEEGGYGEPETAQNKARGRGFKIRKG